MTEIFDSMFNFFQDWEGIDKGLGRAFGLGRDWEGIGKGIGKGLGRDWEGIGKLLN